MPLISTMPALPITADCTVEWVGIDPTSGADVSGVTVQNPTLYGIDLSGNVGQTTTPPSEEPLWLPVPVDTTGPVDGGNV